MEKGIVRVGTMAAAIEPDIPETLRWATDEDCVRCAPPDHRPALGLLLREDRVGAFEPPPFEPPPDKLLFCARAALL